MVIPDNQVITNSFSPLDHRATSQIINPANNPITQNNAR